MLSCPGRHERDSGVDKRKCDDAKPGGVTAWLAVANRFSVRKTKEQRRWIPAKREANPPTLLVIAVKKQRG